MSLEAAHRVKSLIFGSSHLTGTFTDPWLLQGFYFKPDEVTREVPSLACGLVQAQGGPCGMLAVVQAYVIKELLYTGSNERATPSARYDLMTNCKPDQLKRALINAWVEILWMVGDSRLVRACVKNPSAAKMSGARKMANGSTFKPDGITEALSYVELTSKDSVRNFFTVHHSVYADKKGAGCVLFLYSVILTRGVENVEKDRVSAGGRRILIFERLLRVICL
jgi:hypothetical protein